MRPASALLDRPPKIHAIFRTLLRTAKSLMLPIVFQNDQCSFVELVPSQKNYRGFPHGRKRDMFEPERSI